MSDMTGAMAFFDACETGQGWAACLQYCTPDATFSAQADALSGIDSLEAYTNWMTDMVAMMPDARFEMLAVGVDQDRNAIVAAAIFHATHTGEGGPVPPTGKAVSTNYCYVMSLRGGKIAHMIKIWNDGDALRAAGWQ